MITLEKAIREIRLETLLKAGYIYLAMDWIGDLWCYVEKPERNENDKLWFSGGVCFEVPISWGLHDCVKWEDEEPLKIEKLLFEGEN